MLAKENSTTKAPKVKHIYKIHFSCFDSSIEKDKYTVVYENNSYYYCKVHGTDKLLELDKTTVKTVYNVGGIGYFSCEIPLTNEDLTNEYRRKHLSTSYRMCNTVLQRYQQDISKVKNNIEIITQEYKKLFGRDIEEDL